jgi:hypothetical protein
MSDHEDDEAELDEEQEEETKEALRSFRTALEIMKKGGGR